MNREAGEFKDSTMETNSYHATPIKRFPLDRSECGLPIRTSTPISKTNPDVDIARKDSNGPETSFRRLRATVLLDTSDGGQFMVSYDAPAPQMESLANGRPGELSVTQVTTLATQGSLTESHQQHRSSFIARGSQQPSKGSCTDSSLQPSKETCSEFQQQQGPSLTPRGSRDVATQPSETMAFSSTFDRGTKTNSDKPGFGGGSQKASDGVPQLERPLVVARSNPAPRGKRTSEFLRTEAGNPKQVHARYLATGANKDHAKDQKTQVPGKPNLRSKGKTDSVSKETVTRGNTFTIKSPDSDGRPKKPLGWRPSIAVAAKPKLVSESGSAAKSRCPRTNIPQPSVLKGQRLSKRMSDVGTRKTETVESTRIRSRSTSRTSELAGSTFPPSTPLCNFQKQKDARGSTFSTSNETGSMKRESGKSAPASLKGKLARLDMSKVAQTSKRMPPILKVTSPSLKRTLPTLKEAPNLMDANVIANSPPMDVTFDRNGVKDRYLKSIRKGKPEEARNEEEEWHKKSIQYRAPSVESALIKDVPLQPHHHQQQQQHQQKQFENDELRCSMSDVEEEDASLATLSSPVPYDSNQRDRQVAERPMSTTPGELRKQWNNKWSAESFEIKVALNLSQHVDNLLTQLQEKVSDPDMFQLCLGQNARSSLPRYRSDNLDIHGLLENLRSSEKKVKALLEVVEVGLWSSFNREVS